MSAEASAHGLYHSAADLMDAAAEEARREVDEGKDFSWLHNYKPDPDTYEQMAKTTKKVIYFRCHLAFTYHESYTITYQLITMKWN